MKKIVEKTLEAALIKASTELNCSVADLEYEIIQNPSNGFLGLGKKEAIIVVETKNNRFESAPKSSSPQVYAAQKSSVNSHTQEVNQVDKDVNPPTNFAESANKSSGNASLKQELFSQSNGDEYALDSQSIWGGEQSYKSPRSADSTRDDEARDDEANVAQIRSEIETLFSFLPFEIHHFEVKMYDENTLFVYIDGRDCALLIGERGYRYKALSYLLFNWINPKYGYALRLEIAEFLKNQEEMIDVYLKDIVRLVKLNGRAQTKTLDGILVYIALSKLRDLFPDKYVSVRQNEADEKYIIINDFRR
nr:Jag N-terminal domain-containing protein [uncultured Helicobacter sp.]